jgi:CheY-like chemotaxis protein
MIALSGYPGEDIREGSLAAGFDAYLVKPGNILELERLLGGNPAGSEASRH